MKVVAGIESLDIPSLFAAANRRIILHAAVYGPFGKSEPHRNALAKALAQESFERLDIIGLEPGVESAWKLDFCSALRHTMSMDEMDVEIQESWDYILGLASDYPDKIRLHGVRDLPCLPILVIDDTIISGQYAHVDAPAPNGFWVAVKADVEKLMTWAEFGTAPADASKEELAAYRLISECCNAMSREVRNG